MLYRQNYLIIFVLCLPIRLGDYWTVFSCMAIVLPAWMQTSKTNHQHGIHWNSLEGYCVLGSMWSECGRVRTQIWTLTLLARLQTIQTQRQSPLPSALRRQRNPSSSHQLENKVWVSFSGEYKLCLIYYESSEHVCISLKSLHISLNGYNAGMPCSQHSAVKDWMLSHTIIPCSQHPRVRDCETKKTFQSYLKFIKEKRLYHVSSLHLNYIT